MAKTLNPFTQFNDFHVFDLAAVHLEPKNGFHRMKPFITTGTGVKPQAVQIFIELNQQNMRMSANENVWLVPAQLLMCFLTVLVGPASNVRDQNFHVFAQKTVYLRPFGPDGLIIDVAVHTTNRLEFSEFVNDFYVSNITGMPYFVDLGEMGKDFGIEVSVRIGH
jgi:hypothetical protein